jgi:hypothetical protein
MAFPPPQICLEIAVARRNLGSLNATLASVLFFLEELLPRNLLFGDIG